MADVLSMLPSGALLMNRTRPGPSIQWDAPFCTPNRHGDTR